MHQKTSTSVIPAKAPRPSGTPRVPFLRKGAGIQNTYKNLPIGVFDSGIGGLTVLKGLLKALPDERFIYFGDTARVPYGTKSKTVVLNYSREIAHFLIKQQVKCLVVACNTASALAVPTLKKEMSIPIFGVVEAGAREAAKIAPRGKIAVIGTPATINSGVYSKFLKNLAPKAKIFTQACPLFVALAEEGWLNHPVTRAVARIYLKDITRAKPNVMILGCTHYPLLQKTIKGAIHGHTRLVDSPSAVAREVKKELKKLNLLSCCHSDSSNLYQERRISKRGRSFFLHEKQRNQDDRVRFFVSDNPRGFKKMAKLFLGNEPHGPISLIKF